MIAYSYIYNHKTKEITCNFQVGSSQPVKIITGAESFIQDIDFIKNDPKLAHFLSVVRIRKDLPIDHDFGPGGDEIKFNPEDWEGKME